MMWSAMSWLSQKAGINLDDANEVLNGMDNSYATQQSNLGDDQTSEVSKENQSYANNNPKKSRRSSASRWAPSAINAGPPASNPPVTSIMVPTGSPVGYVHI